MGIDRVLVRAQTALVRLEPGEALAAARFSSSLAAVALHRIGLRNSTDVIGGFNAWVAAGLPVDYPPVPRRPRGPGEGES